ncbi:hypothetical protein C1645_811167 [Glomus cerebriforme]|uniref:Sacsin/Nov domain-containing protein n=1 Tax=Glomus cerebriforme TaxID=658196 RepID=A0A397TT40_9GLOM|nr:hypothetical protein C1645_811167 [Glomus cerebriforme]
MSLNNFRNKILSNSDEGRVEFNQRNLIDKILARYSCEFVIYRELMQNSDDAESSGVKIIFETKDNKITRILFKNNGFPFRPEDWKRLVKIAEGNPDEQKIGAFGVGFYSLFSICDNPFVSSGGQGLAFYWRGDRLFTKQGPTNDDDKDWTTFLMDTKEPIDLPDFEEFARFLATSLGFTKHLQEIFLYLDGTLIIELSKKTLRPKIINIAPDFNTFSPQNMFQLTSVDVRGVQLNVKRTLIPTNTNITKLLANECQTEEASILFRVANGYLNVKINNEVSAKMERLTKKKPPNETSIQMIFTEFNELDSDNYDKNISPVFKDLLSYPEQGRIYIGFPTNQTTGCCSHLAARVIPTMERELIDFAEKTLAEYNNEMLCLAGTLSRILYEEEMTQMKQFYSEVIDTNIEDNEDNEDNEEIKETKCKEEPKWLEKHSACSSSHNTSKSKATKCNEEPKWFEKQAACSSSHITSKPRTQKSFYEWFKKRSLHFFMFKERMPNVQMIDYETFPYREWLEKWAAHSLTHFTFDSSTPNIQVSKIAETQFFNCLKQNLFILSTNGILPIYNVRLPNLEMAGFIKTVPVVPKIILEKCCTFFEKAKDTKLIEELTFQDVLHELKSRTLFDEDEIINLFKWWISYRLKGNNAINIFESTQFMQNARIGNNSQALNTIHFFLNPNKIPLDVDIPSDVLSYNISKNFTEQELQIYFGWSELPLATWARFIVNKPELRYDCTFAEKIFQILANDIVNVSEVDKTTIRQVFAKTRCIPTTFGMKIPDESYFESVDLFPDLPTIKFQDFSPNIETLMEHLGVRKVVELNLAFHRLINQENCDYMQLIEYFVKTSSKLNKNEMKILRNKPIWPKENLEDLVDSKPTTEIQRFVASDLYAPISSHRELGLPIIDWKEKTWANDSKEGKLLFDLGLQKYPSLKKILELASPPTDLEIRELALNYFIDNFENAYSKDYNKLDINIAFLPCSDPDIYAKPSECYINDRCTIMEFLTIREDLHPHAVKFKVRQHPDHKELLKRLIEEPPQDENKAKEVFGYLKSQRNGFTDSDWKTLANLKFIPVQDKSKPNRYILTDPHNCFFKLEEESLNDFFPCVDFEKKANKFLALCGVKEPSPADLAALLVNSSYELRNLYKDDVEKYLKILVKISKNFNTINSSLIEKMKEEPILVAIKMDFQIEDYFLVSAKEIYINDDKMYQELFNPFIAPKELETLYMKLGCKSLHDSVEQTVIPSGPIQTTEYSQQLQRMIRERAGLFYLNYPKKEIRNGKRWLKKLKVMEIEYIETSFKLGNITKNEKNDVTTIIFRDKCTGSWILCVTQNSNLIDVSRHIVNNIYKSYDLKDISYFNMVLTASLPSLRNMEILENNKLFTYFQKKYRQSQNTISDRDTNDEEETIPKNTQDLRTFLQDAIKSRYSNSGSIVKSKIKVNESQMNYCDIPGYSLQYVETLQDIELYVPKDLDQSEILSRSRTVTLSQFVNILKDLADVFELSPKDIHIFYDNNANSIAFNRDGTLFFNLKFYLELHKKECEIKPTIDVMTYWFTIFCHELAHNFIQSHNCEFDSWLLYVKVSSFY